MNATSTTRHEGKSMLWKGDRPSSCVGDPVLLLAESKASEIQSPGDQAG